MNEFNPTNKTQSQAQGEAPQKTFEKKKAIIRVNQVIWYVLGLIEVLLAFRFIMKMLGASQTSSFSNLVYGITAHLSLPFSGILGIFTFGNSILEWSTVIAGIVYLCAAWGLTYLLKIIYPISPKDV